jgi:hypothetical protein
MKYVKMFALAAVAAGALMAFIGASSASASVLCSTTADPCPSTQKWPSSVLEFTLSTGTSANLKEPGAGGETIDTCTGSSVKGTLTNGSSTVTANGPISKENLKWNPCTFKTETIAGGTLEVHKIAGTSNGTVTGSGFEVTVLAFGIFTCTYKTGAGKDLGTLTEGKPAVFHAETVFPASGICPESEWSATYTLTSPSNTTLSVSAS